MTIGVGVYGLNGHQIHHLLVNHPHARLVAAAACDPAALPPELMAPGEVRCCSHLAELLSDRRVELVSLCSPRRCDQAGDALLCLRAGKHVYAEKPCAMTERDLDAILEAARVSGSQFHEMAGTAWEQPYLAMRGVVASGALGTIVQVLAQKSYPYHEHRPQDEDVDGGLTMQVGVHALRFVEHVAGQRISEIRAIETRAGNPVDHGGLRMATSYLMRLENGGVASAVANYLNPRGVGKWGNETLRIFGTRGFVEAVDGGTRTRLVLGEKDCGEIDVSAPGKDYFTMFAESLSGLGVMPLSLEDELHPTRMAIRARASASEFGC